MATGTIGAGGNLATSNDVYVTFNTDSTESQSVALDDTPVDFLTMTTIDWTAEYSLVSAWGDDSYSLGIRIVNGATILAAADSGGTFQTVASGITSNTDATTGPTAFTYVNTTANKTVWDGAAVELQQTHGQEMGPDGNALRVDFVSFDIEYPANEITVGSAATTTETASAFLAIDIVSNGSTATTGATANAGGIIYPGGNSGTTDSAVGGSADVVVAGFSAITTDAANAGQGGGDYIEPGAASSTSAAAHGGVPVFVIPGGNPSTTDSANAGQAGGDYIEIGGSASTTETPVVGTLAGNFTVLGQQATTGPTAKNSVPKVYEAEGTLLDEHGRHVRGGIDESGNKYFPKLDPETEGSTLNEHGDWVDLTLVLNETNVLGVQETTTDTANGGIILSANVVNGDSHLHFDTANEGVGRSDAISAGGTSSTTETAHSGAAQSGNAGAVVATTDTANAGSPKITRIGVRVVYDEVGVEGSPTVSPSLIGASSTTTDSAHAGGIGVVLFGAAAATTEEGTSGVTVLPGFIKVQGAKRTTTDQANTGGINISDLRVFGIRVLTQDFPRRGSPSGGEVVYRIMLEPRLDVLV